MANFLVRVVLHSKTDLKHPDYSALHIAMEKAGFSRKVQGSSDKWYHLPPAEYEIDGTYTLLEVHNKAQAVANTIDTDHGILVAQHDNKLQWSGLKQV